MLLMLYVSLSWSAWLYIVVVLMYVHSSIWTVVVRKTKMTVSTPQGRWEKLDRLGSGGEREKELEGGETVVREKDRGDTKGGGGGGEREGEVVRLRGGGGVERGWEEVMRGVRRW